MVHRRQSETSYGVIYSQERRRAIGDTNVRHFTGASMALELGLEATIQEAIVKPVVNFAEKLRRALSEPAGADLLATLHQE